MLFNFTLVPVENVQPWGEPGNLNLHWFGLTAGQYWIEAGEASLLEYSKQVREKFGDPRYCEYYVARLYEDVMEMVPYVLEPIPPVIVPYISGISGQAWEATFRAWMESHDEQPLNDRFWKIVDAESRLTNPRYMITNYLSPPAKIIMWSDESMVHIEWENRDKLFKGVQAWSAVQGAFALPREKFVSEIQSFHSRLMEQMTVRVDQVLAGALSPEIQIDLVDLQREHEFRSLPIDRTIARSMQPTDWRRVHEAIQEVERIA
ncbi:MAG: DUF5984 family protein [Planctomycetales bacterium]|nr:DUF5984 family protein [Planctomycetales bacterium]